MTNYNPNITSSAATGSFNENSNTTGSMAAHVLSGTMNFKDSDHNDTHTTSASLKSAVLSTGSVIPATALANLNSAMASVIQSDNNGSGKLKWTFNAADNDFDFLANGQKLVLTYEIHLNDNHGGTTKKTVKVTITGTDDRPVIDFGTTASVSEQEGQTLSFAPDAVDIAVHFVDPDLTNTGHTATVIGAAASGATGGLLPGFLGTLELMSFFHVENVVKASGSSNGTINTRFSAPDLAFDYLSDGETLDITYTVRLNDNAGMTSTQTVVVTVFGTNDGPCIIGGPDTRHLTEGENLSPAGDLTASGDFHFGDIDLSDSHTVSTTVTATRSGGGAVPISNADLVAAMSTSLDDGFIFSEVDWNFALDNDAVSFLNSGETLILTYTIMVDDGAGGSDSQTVTVTILGTNDPVVITSEPQSASLAEFADTTGSAALNTTTPVPTGAIAFTDTDIGDTHTVMVSVAAAVWSGGPAVPSGTDADLPTALLTTLNDSTGSGIGSVDWTFSITDSDLDFLAFGETLTIDYTVEVSDGPSGSSQTVTITVDGANDTAVITGAPGTGSVAELPNTTGSSTPASPIPNGTLAFTDVDFNDMHLVGVAISSIVWSGGEEIPGGSQLELTSALLTTLNDSTGSGSGNVDWSFSIADSALDFLSAGETLTVTYDVTVSDAAATSLAQTVTITITGAEDPLIVNPVTAAASDTINPDAGTLLAIGNLIVDGGDTAGDLNTTLTITDVNGSAANVGTFVAGTYGDLLVFDDGTYLYIANSNIDVLQFGDNPTEQFTFTVTDSLSRSESTTLTFNVAGASDAPTITAAEAFGSMTEDLGPSSATNGDFESGDLTGWVASDPGVETQFLGIGGELGNYAARLAPTGSVQTLYQNVATTPGQLYTVSFYIAGDPEATSNEVVVTWDGETQVVVSNDFGGFTQYSFTVLANASLSTTQLLFAYHDDGIAMYVDEVKVESVTGPATESADGTIAFADIETADTHTVSFVPQSGDYVGTFSLGAVTEGGGAGSFGWDFTVNNSEIQFLALGQTVTQTYTVSVTDNFGATVTQDVAVAISGTNDAPTAVGADTVITDAGVDGGLFIPGWTLTGNDTDTDTLDTLFVNSITGESGGDAFLFGGVIFFDDTTLGGSFTYDTTDGSLVSAGSGTVTVVNNPSSPLNGTGGNDIIISTVGGSALNGGGGDDILIGNSGAHLLTGGSGDDIFSFQLLPDDVNEITDFDNTVDHDLIGISAAAFGGGLTAGMDVSLVFESTADAEFVGGLLHYDTTANALYFSSDGTTASAILVAQLQSGVLLNAQDLLIV
jgi:VCBS repeat-containing protein